MVLIFPFVFGHVIADDVYSFERPRTFDVMYKYRFTSIKGYDLIFFPLLHHQDQNLKNNSDICKNEKNGGHVDVSFMAIYCIFKVRHAQLSPPGGASVL